MEIITVMQMKHIRLGEEIGRAGAGDCDDFAIIMAAFIENIGGTTRINLVHDESQGHAYTGGVHR